MGAISDVTSEFKQAGSKEKAVIIIGVIAVGGVAWYLYTHKQATATQQGVAESRPSASGGTPSIGGTPFIGSNVNPLYDPAGNLVAFQGSPPPSITPIQGGNPPSTGPAPANWLGSIPNYSKVWAGGMNADGSQRYWFTPPGGQQTMFTVPQGTRVYAGGSGRWWYAPPNGSQTALTVNH